MLLHELSCTGLHRFFGAHDNVTFFGLRWPSRPGGAKYCTLSTPVCVHQGPEKTLLSILYASFSAEILG